MEDLSDLVDEVYNETKTSTSHQSTEHKPEIQRSIDHKSQAQLSIDPKPQIQFQKPSNDLNKSYHQVSVATINRVNSYPSSHTSGNNSAQLNQINNKKSYTNSMVDSILSQHLDNYGMNKKSESVEQRNVGPVSVTEKSNQLSREDQIRRKMRELKELGVNTDGMMNKHRINIII